MKISKAYDALCQTLRKAGFEDAAFEADIILQHVSGESRFNLNELTETQWQMAQELVARRTKHEPFQYLLGKWGFLGLELHVGPGVLIPRPETEEVCLAAVEAVRDISAPVVLDLCAGSGALALGLQSLVPDAHITAVELDGAAFLYLEKNVGCYGGVRSPTPVRADALDYYITIAPRSVDLIICNPPYVTEAEYTALAPELSFEPKQALVPPSMSMCEGSPTDDGLLFYRAIAQNYMACLRSSGQLVFEIGSKQGVAVQNILSRSGYKDIHICNDMAGNNRIAIAKRG